MNQEEYTLKLVQKQESEKIAYVLFATLILQEWHLYGRTLPESILAIPLDKVQEATSFREIYQIFVHSGFVNQYTDYLLNNVSHPYVSFYSVKQSLCSLIERLINSSESSGAYCSAISEIARNIQKSINEQVESGKSCSDDITVVNQFQLQAFIRDYYSAIEARKMVNLTGNQEPLP